MNEGMTNNINWQRHKNTMHKSLIANMADLTKQKQLPQNRVREKSVKYLTLENYSNSN